MLLRGLGRGYVGGILPDVIEPALHSWHRAECHDATALAGVIAGGVESVGEFEKSLLSGAADLRAKRLALPVNHRDRLALGLQEFALYLSYGAIIGLAAGYASPLILDMGTKRGIPLIGKGL